MSLYSRFKLSESKTEKGVNVSIEDAIFTLRPMNASNKEYQKALADTNKRYRVQLKTETLSPLELNRVMLEVFCSTILIGWQNVKDENDQDMQFNLANSVKLMTDLPVLYDTLAEIANDHKVFLDQALEEDLKN